VTIVFKCFNLFLTCILTVTPIFAHTPTCRNDQLVDRGHQTAEAEEVYVMVSQQHVDRSAHFGDRGKTGPS
jgi:hypothetical protein